MAEGALTPACRRVLQWLAPAGERSRLSILIFHRVLSARDPLQPGEPTADEFERQLKWVKAWFNVLPLSAAVHGLTSGCLPERPLVITFDDGYADNFEVALPILKRLQLPSTFFVASGFLDGGRMFNDTITESVRQAKDPALDLADLGLGSHALGNDAERRRAIGALLAGTKYLPPPQREERVLQIAERCRASLPAHLMMTSSQVAAMHAAGMEIGGHTVSHPILNEVSPDDARHEIERGRRRLEEITGTRIRLFAFPNGRPGRDYRAQHVQLVREAGFEAAVSTAWGVATRQSDRFQLPRFTPWDRRSWSFALRMLRNMRLGGPTEVAA